MSETLYYNRQKARENYQYYVRNGRCPKCGGKNPVMEGKHVCRECALRLSEQRHARRIFYKESGLCSRCGKPLPEDSRFLQCEDCRGYFGAYYKFNKARYERLKDECKCVKCGEWAEPGRTMCRKCLDDHRAYEKSYGEAFLEKRRKRRQERIAAGLCIDCGRPTDEGHTRCKRCRDMRMDSTRKYRIHQRTLKEATQWK